MTLPIFNNQTEGEAYLRVPENYHKFVNDDSKMGPRMLQALKAAGWNWDAPVVPQVPTNGNGHHPSKETEDVLDDIFGTPAQQTPAQHAKPSTTKPASEPTVPAVPAVPTAEPIALSADQRQAEASANPTQSFFESIARPLIERGWRVAPCHPYNAVDSDGKILGKAVDLPDPLNQRSNDPAQIRAWGLAKPQANVCVYAVQEPGGLCFVDKDGAISLVEKYERETGKQFPRTLLVCSSVTDDSKGGKITKGHWYFLQTPKTMALAGNIGEDKTGGLFSFRVSNQYVTSIGSIHPKTGKPYEIYDDVAVAPIPDDFVDWLYAQVAAKPKTAAEAQQQKLSKGSRYPALISYLGKLWSAGTPRKAVIDAGLAWAEDHFELPEGAFNSKLVEGEIEHYLDHGYEQGQPVPPLQFGQAGPTDAGALTFKHSKVDGSHRNYVVNPVMGQTDGWFPLGSVSLVGGSSGSNKTTWVLDLLYAQWHRQEAWGHRTGKRPYLVFMFDRGKDAHTRTMERLGYSLGEIPVRFLPPVTDGAAVTAILNHLEAEAVRPEVVFVEGADMLVADANKGQFVVPFMSALQKIAEHYHIAFILSVGAPKMRIGEGYTAKRDSMLGSEKWSRMSETVVAMQFVEGDDVDCRRACFVLLRNGPAERFDLALRDGKLVLDTGPRPVPATQYTRAKNAVEEAKTWYTTLFAEHSVNGEGRVVTLDDHRKALRGTDIPLLPARTLEKARDFLGIYYDKREQVYTRIASASEANAVDLNAEVDPQQQAAETLFQAGKSVRKVATELGVPKTTVARWRKQWADRSKNSEKAA